MGHPHSTLWPLTKPYEIKKEPRLRVPYCGLCATVGSLSRKAPRKEKGRCVQRPKVGVVALAQPCRAAKVTALWPDPSRHRCWCEAWLSECASDIQPATAVKT